MIKFYLFCCLILIPRRKKKTKNRYFFQIFEKKKSIPKIKYMILKKLLKNPQNYYPSKSIPQYGDRFL